MQNSFFWWSFPEKFKEVLESARDWYEWRYNRKIDWNKYKSDLWVKDQCRVRGKHPFR